MRDDRFDHAARGVEQQHAAFVVRDEDPAVAMDLQPVRPAVIFGDELPSAIGRDPENAAIGDVGDPKVPCAIEARPLQEAIDLPARLVRRGPGGRGVGDAELIRHARPDVGVEDLRRRIEGHAGSF